MHISSPQEQNSPEHVIGQLSSLIDKAKSISTEKRLGILGTTIEAAFVKTLLGERISFFVDENPARVGTDFYENHVLNPKQLSENDCVFIPISDGADNIKKRLTAIYPAEFINLQ